MMLPPPECKVYTPPQLAKAIVEALEPNKHDNWLDPCMGPGAFIAQLRAKGITKDRIVGIDIDNLAGPEDTSATTIRGIDFFKWCATTKQQFTRIVANPPYVPIRKLHPELQRSLVLFGKGSDKSFALRSNYWCAFLSACLHLLSDCGNLAFVLPASWEYALYAEDIRRSVLQQFQTVEVHRSLEPLFPNVREGCIVLLAKGFGRQPAKSLRVDYCTSEDLITALKKGTPRAAGTTILRPSYTVDGSLTLFSDLYQVKIGCVTGNARYFLLTESDRIRLALSEDAVYPVLSRARHLTAAYLTSTEWNLLRKTDERVWLFRPNPKALRQKAVRAYIEHGEKICDLAGCKLRQRDQWYCVPDIDDNAVGFMSGMTKLGPYICFRSKPHLTATNTLYVLTAKTKMRLEEHAAWALSLLSTTTRRQFQETARRYPDGLAKLEPNDVNSLRLLRPFRVSGASESYRQAVSYLLAGKLSHAVAIADAFTTQPCVGRKRLKAYLPRYDLRSSEQY